MIKRVAMVAMALIVGVLVGPLLIALLAGVARDDGLQRNVGFNSEWDEAAELFDAYRFAYPDDESIKHRIENYGLSSRDCPIRAEFSAVKPDVGLLALSPDGAQRAADYRTVVAINTARRSTRFGRRFLAACLRIPVYRAACRSAARAILAIPAERARAAMQPISAGYDQAICTYAAGFVVRHSEASPSVSTP